MAYIFTYRCFKHFKPGTYTFDVFINSLFILSILSCFIGGAANAQAPVITPKTQLIFALDNTGNRIIQPTDVATITSGVTTSPVVSVSPNTLNCSSLGLQTVTVTASNSITGPNDASNTSTQQIQIAVTSTPVFGTYNGVIITADVNCNATIPDYTANPQVSDACSNAHLIVTQSPVAGTPIPVNTPTTITLTAKDEYGGISAAFFSVTSFSSPVITPVNGPITLKLDASGNYTVTLADLATVSTCDNSPITTTISPQTLSCADVGQTSITITASTSRPNPQAVTFSVPTNAVTDEAGNIYVADGYSCSIRKIATDGMVTTFAGGTCGYADGKGAAAQFNILNGLTIDSQGNLYAIDENYRVRKITPDGTATTLAGSGANESVDGTGTDASFHNPRGIAIDASGNLYITQGSDYLVRKVTPAGVVTTVTPPSSVSKLYIPTGITTDAAGNLYVTDFSNAIKKITPDGKVTIIAGHEGSGSADGVGSAASFNMPKGITFDNQGNLYVTDSQNNAIRKIDPSGVVTTLQLYMAGTTNKALLNNPIGIKMDPFGNFIVVDSDNERIVRITPTGQLTVIAGNGVAGNQNGNANTPPMIGNETALSIPVTVANSDNSTIPPGSVIPVVTVMPQNATACVGEPVIFTANTQPSNTIVNYQWLVNNIDAGTNSPSFSSTTLNDGDAVICIISNTASCIVPKSSDPISVHINPLPKITFPDNPTIKQGNSVVLQPEITGNIMTYAWTPATGLSNTIIANPIADPGTTMTYFLQVTSTAGCQTIAKVTVNVLVPIYVPNTFTPNGDGVNDLWDISSLLNYPNCTVDVFNRYGQSLFHSRGYSKPWDGTFNGNQLQPGVYYYIIDPKVGLIKPLSGWVSIMR